MDWIPNLDATPLALIIMTVSVLVSTVGLFERRKREGVAR